MTDLGLGSFSQVWFTVSPKAMEAKRPMSKWTCNETGHNKVPAFCLYQKSWAAFHHGLWGPGKQGDLPFQDPKVMFSRVLPSPVLADPGGKHLPPVGLGPATVTLGFGISPVNSMSWTPITLVLIYLPSLFVVRIQVCLGHCWISPIEVSIFNSIWLIPYQCIRHLC